jgi:uncharacterized protein YjiS (DUF1127 family)
MIAFFEKGRVMAAPDIFAFLKLGLGTLTMWRERGYQRCQLHELVEDPNLLCFVGLTKAEALAEACRPFWSTLHHRKHGTSSPEVGLLQSLCVPKPSFD